MEIETVRLGHQPGHRRLPQNMTPPSFVRTSNEDVPDSVSAGKVEQRRNRFFRTESYHLSA
jgi:hypothetical protein